VRQANPGPAGPFPVEVKELQRDLVETLHGMHERFRNLKMDYLLSNTRTTERGGSVFLASIEGAATSCALSSGRYAGYATRPAESGAARV